jgi:WD40 repeat protein
MHRPRTALAIVLLALGWLWASTARGQAPLEIPPARMIQVPQDGNRGQAVVSAIARSRDGGLLASAGDDHVVRLWSPRDTRLLASLRGHSDWVRAVDISPDGQMLVSGGDDRTIIFWEIPSGRRLRVLSPPVAAVYSLQFSPDGTLLAAAGFGEKLLLYRSDGQVAGELTCSCQDIRALAFSPDGQWLAAAGRDARITLWDVTTRREVLSVQDPDRRRLRAVAFSPDGRLLAAGGEGQHVRVWDTRDGQQRAALVSRPGKTMALAFLDNERLAAGSTDNLIRIWNVRGAVEERNLLGHKGSVTSLAFHAASGELASGSYDTTILFWSIGPDENNTASRPREPAR